MKVLVTGGTGFIGSHLVDQLLADHHTVRCVVRRSSRHTWLAGKPVEFLECDRICDAGLIREAVRGVEIVFHALGTLAAPNLEAYREVNVRPVRMILDACREQGGLKRFVLAGSHGAAGPTPEGKDRINESDPCHPVSAYGRSKLEAEEATREFQGIVPWTILRLSAVYGPRDSNFLKMFTAAFRHGVIPQIGRQPKAHSLAHVHDIVTGMARAAIAEKALNETYFLASEEPCSSEDLRAAFAAAMNRKVKVFVIPGLVVAGLKLWSDVLAKVFGKHILLSRDRLATLSYPRWVCDVSKARADLGFQQSTSLMDGIRETFEWYRQEGWL